MSSQADMAGDAVTFMDDSTRRYYLDAMGIQCWELIERSDESNSTENIPAAVQAQHAATAITQLEAEVQQCVRCQLHKSRTQAITGRGNASADLMFALLSPDSNDDQAGQLCSGQANELFAKMLAAINIAIDDVYITSLLKCSVPAQHTISTTELHHCKDYLVRQIELVQPGLLVVIGETAARCILQQDASLDDLRSRLNPALQPGVAAQQAAGMIKFASVPLFVSYSPHELIRQPGNKRKAWHDLQQLQKIIEA